MENSTTKRVEARSCVIGFDICGLSFRSEPMPLSELPQTLASLYNNGVSSVIVEKQD